MKEFLEPLWYWKPTVGDEEEYEFRDSPECGGGSIGWDEDENEDVEPEFISEEEMKL